MTTPAPSAHAIKDREPDQWPCWLWSADDQKWIWFDTRPSVYEGELAIKRLTHWLPVQRIAPTSRPDQPAVKPPAVEGTEWAKRAVEEIGLSCLRVSMHKADYGEPYVMAEDAAAIILKHAPSQPRQEGATEQAVEKWDGLEEILRQETHLNAASRLALVERIRRHLTPASGAKPGDGREDALSEFVYWTKGLLQDLPVNRDWLDPETENNLRDLVERVPALLATATPRSSAGDGAREEQKP